MILVAVPTATPSSLMVMPLILPLPPPVALIVTSPVLELTETLVPATILVTGVPRVVPSPRAVYSSSKLEFIFIAPDNKLSPVPSLGVEPVLIPSLDIFYRSFRLVI